jgi:hypothetical protein
MADSGRWGKVQISAEDSMDFVSSFGSLHKKLKIACLESSVRVSDSCIVSNLAWLACCY